MSHNFFLLYLLIIILENKILKGKVVNYLENDNISYPISNDSENLIEDNNIKIDQTDIIPIVSYLRTNMISADKNKKVKLDLPFETGDIGTDIMELLYISKQGEIFPIKKYVFDYNINYTNVINDFDSKTIKNYEDANDLQLHCSYNVSDLKYNVTKIDMIKYDKYIRYSYFTFALNSQNKKVLLLSYENRNLIKIKEINLFENNETNYLSKYKIKNFFLVNHYYLEKDYLIFHSTNNNLLVYEIQTIDYKNFSLFFQIIIDLKDLIKDNDQIIKIGIYEQTYIISTEFEGLNRLIGYSNNTEWLLRKIKNQDTKYKCIDFLVTKFYLFAVFENNGLTIYKTTDNFSKNRKINHPYMKSIDYYINPFYNLQFIGIYAEPHVKDNYNEFYFEFYMDKFCHIKLNKIYVLNSEKKNINIKPFLVDNFYMYFYDNLHKKVYLVRRGLLNSIPFISYQFNLNTTNIYNNSNTNSKSKNINDNNIKNINNISEIISLYDSLTEKQIPTFVANDSLILVEDMMFPNHTLMCIFQDEGNFNLTLIQHGEVCANSLEASSYSDKLFTCQKIASYNFYIYKSDFYFNTIVMIVAGALNLSLFFILLCAFNCNCKLNFHFDEAGLDNMDIKSIDKFYQEEEDSSKESENDYDYTNKNKNILIRNKNISNQKKKSNNIQKIWYEKNLQSFEKQIETSSNLKKKED